MLPDLIQAIKAPFSILGESLLSISLLIFVTTSLIGGIRARKIRNMSGLLALFAICVTAMVIFESAKQLANDRAYRDMHAMYSVVVTIKGSVEKASISDPVSFRASSGQINVGCNDRQITNAVWSVPAGAQDIQASASWENTDNAKDLSQSVSIRDGTATASGAITGLDRNFFGNCSGGGHGELVMRGTYRVLQTESHGDQVLRTVSDKVNRLQPFIVELPKQLGAKPESCEIAISEGLRKELIAVGLKTDNSGKIMIVSQKTISISGNVINVSVSLEEDRVVIRVV
jgi:hypothetical protein